MLAASWSSLVVTYLYNQHCPILLSNSNMLGTSVSNKVHPLALSVYLIFLSNCEVHKLTLDETSYQPIPKVLAVVQLIFPFDHKQSILPRGPIRCFFTCKLANCIKLIRTTVDRTEVSGVCFLRHLCAAASICLSVSVAAESSQRRRC